MYLYRITGLFDRGDMTFRDRGEPFCQDQNFSFAQRGVWSKICFCSCPPFLTFAILIFGRISKQSILSGLLF